MFQEKCSRLGIYCQLFILTQCGISLSLKETSGKGNVNLSGICSDFVHPRPKDIDGNADTNRMANTRLIYSYWIFYNMSKQMQLCMTKIQRFTPRQRMLRKQRRRFKSSYPRLIIFVHVKIELDFRNIRIRGALSIGHQQKVRFQPPYRYVF